MLRVLDLFSGIGGFAKGLEDTGGFQTIAFCEIDPFCQKVLKKHWPTVPIFEDIKALSKEELDKLGTIDVICGGFPCQPVSCAGKRKGNKDERWMWPEFYRIICEVKPRWVLVENVPGLLSANSGRLFGGILRDLAKSGYDAEWYCLKASDFGALHRRERLFLVAYSNSERCGNGIDIDGKNVVGLLSNQARNLEKKGERRNAGVRINKTDPIVFTYDMPERIQRFREKQIQEQQGFSWCKDVRRIEDLRGRSDIPEPLICRKDYGVRGRMDRLRALGNAIVPQVAQYVGNCILEYERQQERILDEPH